MQSVFTVLLLFCTYVVSCNKLTVYGDKEHPPSSSKMVLPKQVLGLTNTTLVQEAAPVPFSDVDILSQFLFAIAKSPHSENYKLVVLKAGLNVPEVHTNPSYKAVADILAADGDKVALWVDPRTFYNEAFMEIELPAGDTVVGTYTLNDGVTPALKGPKVLILSDQEHFDKYKFGELKEVGKYEITQEEIKPIKE